MNRKKLFFICLMLMLGVMLTACTNDNNDEETQEETEDIHKEIESPDEDAGEPYDPEPNPEAAQVSSYNQDRLDEQADNEETILNEYYGDLHQLDNPYVKVDPYDTAPLTALVMFVTPRATQVKVTVGTGEDEQPIEKEWEDFKVNHEIPVLGLYPDQDNIVTIETTDRRGETKTSEVVIETDALPSNLADVELIESNPEEMESGLTFVTPTNGPVIGVDENADVRWYSSASNRLVFNRISNGNLIFMTKDEEASQYNELLETDMLGKIANAYNIEIEGYDDNNLVHHDIIELPNGNFLATTHEPNGDYVEDHMHEIDRETGETTQEINLRDIFPKDAPEDYEGKNEEKGDWVHQNAIWFDDSDNSILISGRSQDLIMKMSYPEGDIKWILGEHEKWPEDYEQYLLEPLSDDLKFPAGQHAMKLLDRQEDAGNDTIKNMILFDNNEVFTRGDEEVSGDYSRAVQYEIDEEEMTVDEIWSFGEERGEDFFSHIVGNVEYQYNTDNVLITSGAIDDDESPTGVQGRVVEADTLEDDHVIFEIRLTGTEENGQKFTYRAIRLPLYPEEGWEFTINDEKE